MGEVERYASIPAISRDNLGIERLSFYILEQKLLGLSKPITNYIEEHPGVFKSVPAVQYAHSMSCSK